MTFRHKAALEKLDNKEYPKRDKPGDIKEGEKEKNLLSKLGAWETWERAERERGGVEGSGENV